MAAAWPNRLPSGQGSERAGACLFGVSAAMVEPVSSLRGIICNKKPVWNKTRVGETVWVVLA